jgi:hypothetical protein
MLSQRPQLLVVDIENVDHVITLLAADLAHDVIPAVFVNGGEMVRQIGRASVGTQAQGTKNLRHLVSLLFAQMRLSAAHYLWRAPIKLSMALDEKKGVSILARL